MLPKDGHIRHQWINGRVAYRLHFERVVGMAALELPPLQIHGIGEDVIGIHAGFANKGVNSNKQGQLFRVTQNGDVGMAGGQRVDWRPHVEHEGFDRVGVSIANGGDDLLVNVAGKGVPVAFGWIPLKDGAFFVFLAVADDAGAKGGHAAAHVANFIRLPRFAAIIFIGGGFDQAAGVVVVADEGVEGVPGQDVVEAVGVLADAAMNIGDRLLAVIGEFKGDFFNVTHTHAADVGPFGQGVLVGGVADDLQAALDRKVTQFQVVYQEVAVYGRFRIIRVYRRRLPIYQRHKVVKFVGFLRVGGERPFFLIPQPNLAGPQIFARLAVFVQLHQPGGRCPGGFGNGVSGGFVGGREVTGIVTAIINHPLHHRQRQRRFRARQRRQPLPRFRRRLAQARVYHGHLHAIHQAIRNTLHPQRRAIVPFKRGCAHKDDKLAVLHIPLPVKLRTARPLAIRIRLRHRLTGEVKAALANGGMAVGIIRAIRLQETADEIFAGIFQAAPGKDKLVVLWPHVWMIRVDHGI